MLSQWMHPDKTQTRHMQIGQFNRLRVNQHLVCTDAGEIFILEDKRCVCDKAAILGEVNKAD